MVKAGTKDRSQTCWEVIERENETVRQYTQTNYNTDLVYVLDNAALKEYIILENRNAPNAFSFLFSMDGLTMQTGEGTASFRDAAGKNIFALDSLFAIDSNGVQTEALSYTFTPFKDTGKMIVTVTGARLDVQKSSGATPTIKAYRCTGSWSSSTITWNNKPAFTTTAASPTCTPYSTGSTWFCMDVSSYG